MKTLLALTITLFCPSVLISTSRAALIVTADNTILSLVAGVAGVDNDSFNKSAEGILPFSTSASVSASDPVFGSAAASGSLDVSFDGSVYSSVGNFSMSRTDPLDKGYNGSVGDIYSSFTAELNQTYSINITLHINAFGSQKVQILEFTGRNGAGALLFDNTPSNYFTGDNFTSSFSAIFNPDDFGYSRFGVNFRIGDVASGSVGNFNSSSDYTLTATFTPVPEPSVLSLLIGAGVLVTGFLWRAKHPRNRCRTRRCS